LGGAIAVGLVSVAFTKAANEAQDLFTRIPTRAAWSSR